MCQTAQNHGIHEVGEQILARMVDSYTPETFLPRAWSHRAQHPEALFDMIPESHGIHTLQPNTPADPDMEQRHKRRRISQQYAPVSNGELWPHHHWHKMSAPAPTPEFPEASSSQPSLDNNVLGSSIGAFVPGGCEHEDEMQRSILPSKFLISVVLLIVGEWL